MRPSVVARAGRPRCGLVVATLAACLLAACGPWFSSSRIDSAWHRKTAEEAHTALWLKHAPTANGFFRTAFNRQWQPLEKQPGDLVGQARAIYVLAAGFDLTQRPEYLAQVKKGTDFMLEAYADRTHGGWFEAVAPDGTPVNRNKRLYSQAFALFALAHAHRVSGEARYREAALATWKTIQDRFGEPEGGYRAGTGEDFRETKLDHSQNPLMHLFEALLALHDAARAPEAMQGAQAVAKFVTGRLMQGLANGGACIPEHFDKAWKPAQSECRGSVDFGHQFEWAHLLSAGVERGMSPVYLEVARRLLDFALAAGYDKTDLGVFTALDGEGMMDRRKFWWQQAEALRALLRHAVLHERADLWGRATQMTSFIRDEFLDGENGGWRMRSQGECARGGCPELQPDGYHMVAMHLEAIRLAETAGKR